MDVICRSAGDFGSRSSSISFFPRHLVGRLYLLGTLAAIECVACFPNIDNLFGHQRLPHIVIVAFAAFLALGYSKLKAEREDIPFGRFFFGAHLVFIAAVLCSTWYQLLFGAGRLLSGTEVHAAADAYSKSPAGYAWSAVYLMGTLLLALACVPLRIWIRAIRATSPVWLYALITGAGAWVLYPPFVYAFFNPLISGPSSGFQVFTFDIVRAVMGFLLPNLVSDAATVSIGTPGYDIMIAGGCSGIEGLGLVLAFTAVWLWYIRRETRFLRALLLIPGALVCIWLLNIIRLCTLIYVGSEISPEVADIGLHSQFGWISFTVVALAFTMATQKLSWARKVPAFAVVGAGGDAQGGAAEIVAGAAEERGESPAIRAYLVPFLAILAASFVSKALSGHFEWLYPLRFVAAAVALWHFRLELKKLNWRFGWFGLAAGAAVFLVWIAPSWWAHQHAPSPIGPALAALSPTARWSWIVFRVAAAVITVPIAEELAFRGYLARRFMDREFDRIPFTSLTTLSVVLSSVAFGVMHGQHWAAGILAGLAYAAALRWRGRMGDAVAAHAVSNLLLAVWVLAFGDWAQW
jgi:exosortase E/protease (VPEID-CTERM system)